MEIDILECKRRGDTVNMTIEYELDGEKQQTTFGITVEAFTRDKWKAAINAFITAKMKRLAVTDLPAVDSQLNNLVGTKVNIDVEAEQ